MLQLFSSHPRRVWRYDSVQILLGAVLLAIAGIAQGAEIRSGHNVARMPAQIAINDEEAPTLAVTLPAEVFEGITARWGNGIIRLSRPATTSTTVYLMTDPPGQLQLSWGSVLIPAGETQVTFTVNAADDNYLDRDVLVKLTATAAGIASASATTIARDNDTREIHLWVPPTVQEGTSIQGQIRLRGIEPGAGVMVQLSSSDPQAAPVPQTIAMRAGQDFVTFDVIATENAAADGARNVTITASASGYLPGSAATDMRDNEVRGYLVAAASDVVDRDRPVTFTVSAADRAGNSIAGGSGTVTVEIVQADGSSQPASPPVLTLSGTTTTGTTAIPPGASPPLRIRVSDDSGRSGESEPFRFLRVLTLKTVDLVADPIRQRIYASVPSNAPERANQVVSINPSTGEITGSAPTGDNPGQLALTAGGEALYVALNGSGAVARIDPASMSVVSTFSMGTTSSGNRLYAQDLATVRSDPNLLVVLRGETSERLDSLIVFDQGVARPNKLQASGVEPSGDTDIVFAAGGTGGLRRVKVDANGLTTVMSTTTTSLGRGATADGSVLASLDGRLVDGSALRSRGSFLPPQTFAIGGVRPEVATQRVYFIESTRGSQSDYDRVIAYDLESFARAGSLRIPRMSAAATLIRWGESGLAFRCGDAFQSNDKLVLLDAAAVVPSEAPTDLGVTVDASPATAASGQPVRYSVRVRNGGSNRAANAVVTARLSDGQVLMDAAASSGSVSVAERAVTWRVGEIEAGSTTTLTIDTKSNPAASISCTASVASDARDPNFRNDAAVRFVPVGFRSEQDVLNHVRLGVNNLIVDRTRDLLWASFDRSVPPPLGRSVVSINPRTGEVSEPMPLDGHPAGSAMAISGNGRYLYVGFDDQDALARVDLVAGPPQLTRIEFAPVHPWGGFAPKEIEVLDGDGTSFLASSTSGQVAVFDGVVRRPDSLLRYPAMELERTATPNVFLGYTASSSSKTLVRLLVTSSGVSVANEASDIANGGRIAASGDFALTFDGVLADTRRLTRAGNLGMEGHPCVDAPNDRGYLHSNSRLYAFSLATKAPLRSLHIPAGARQVVRWGVDGFAVSSSDRVYLTRWSAAVSADVDQDSDGISDAWEAQYFGTLASDVSADPDRDGISSALEYFFGSSPVAGTDSPLAFGIEDRSEGTVMHLVYQRRSDVPPQRYRYETSAGLLDWTTATGVNETILGTEMVDGVQLVTVDAALPAQNAIAGFARLRWIAP